MCASALASELAHAIESGADAGSVHVVKFLQFLSLGLGIALEPADGSAEPGLPIRFVHDSITIVSLSSYLGVNHLLPNREPIAKDEDAQAME